jgi:hypothetical protein
MNIIVLAYDDGKVCYRDTGVEYSIPLKITFTEHCSRCIVLPLLLYFPCPILRTDKKIKIQYILLYFTC